MRQLFCTAFGRLTTIAALSLALGGCYSAGMGSDALTTAAYSVGPDGRPAQMVSCGQVAWCTNRAAAVCGAQGRAPVILDTKATTGQDYIVNFRCT